MDAKEKVTRTRDLYIRQNGDEPTCVIIGYSIFANKEIQTALSNRMLYGMRIIIDNAKPYRVEVGNYTVM